MYYFIAASSAIIGLIINFFGLKKADADSGTFFQRWKPYFLGVLYFAACCFTVAGLFVKNEPKPQILPKYSTKIVHDTIKIKGEIPTTKFILVPGGDGYPNIERKTDSLFRANFSVSLMTTGFMSISKVKYEIICFKNGRDYYFTNGDFAECDHPIPI